MHVPSEDDLLGSSPYRLNAGSRSLNRAAGAPLINPEESLYEAVPCSSRPHRDERVFAACPALDPPPSEGGSRRNPSLRFQEQ